VRKKAKLRPMWAPPVAIPMMDGGSFMRRWMHDVAVEEIGTAEERPNMNSIIEGQLGAYGKAFKQEKDDEQET
jgi:hypothetical protein